MSRTDQITSLGEAVGQLDRDELDVLIEVARGLVAGRKIYGELVLADDRRDFMTEAQCELRDALVYTAAARLVRARAQAEPSVCERFGISPWCPLHRAPRAECACAGKLSQ